jgi:hypothetical protein
MFINIIIKIIILENTYYYYKYYINISYFKITKKEDSIM